MGTEDLTNICRLEHCNVVGIHAAHKGRRVRKKRGGTQGRIKPCPECGLVKSKLDGQCQGCGWTAPWRRKPKAVKKNTLPAPSREVLTEGGVVLLREWKCPSCDGRGWLVAGMDACFWCKGRGVLSDAATMTAALRERGQ